MTIFPSLRGTRLALQASALLWAVPAAAADDIFPAQIAWPEASQRSPTLAGLFGLTLCLLVLVTIMLLVARRQQRRALADKQRLSRYLRGSRAGAWEWNVATGETRYDERWAEIVGYELAELEPVSHETWEKLAHADDRVECRKRLQQHFFGRSNHYEMEIRLRHGDGHWVWVRDSGQVMTRTAEGKPEWMFGTHLDVTSRRSAQAERDGWLERFDELSSNVPGVIYQFRLRRDGSSHFPFASSGLRDIFGCSPEDVREDAAPAFEVVHADDMPEVSRSIDRSAETLDTWHQVYRVEHPKLGLRWVEGTATPSRRPDGSITWHGYIRDITDLHRALERVRTAATVFESSHEGIIISDIDGRLRDVNHAFERLTGYGAEEIRGTMPTRLLAETEREETADEIRSALRSADQWNGEVSIRHESGQTFPAELSISAVRDDDNRLTHYIALIDDITSRKAQEDRLGEIANRDPLTGVGNRRMADARLQSALGQAQRAGVTFAVCMLDLDEFKPINDQYGHDAGDQVLKTITQRLLDLVRADDSVCRLGGDEFLIILRQPQGEAVFERILDSIRIPIRIEVGIVRVSSSLGITLCDADCDTDAEGVLRRADRAVYAAKSAGRDCFRFDTD